MTQEIQIDPLARYRVVETAKLLGISRATLDRHAKDGKIKYKVHRLTGKRFFRGMDILKYWNAYV